MNSERIVVSGMGIASPSMSTIDHLWNAVTGTGPLVPEDSETMLREVPRSIRRRYGVASQLATLAAMRASVSAGLERAEIGRAGLINGSSYGDMGKYRGAPLIADVEDGLRVEAAIAATLASSSIASAPAQVLGLEGPCGSVSMACASGNFAIETAARYLSDTQPLMLAGGVELLPPPGVDLAFDRLGVISSSGVCRPFDALRDGMLPAVGAAYLVLELERHARARGVAPMAVFLGGHSAADPKGLWRLESPDVLARCIEASLQASGCSAGDVGWFNAHGSGTIENDRLESRAVVQAFPQTPVSSVKGAIGHMGGAAGAFEACVSVEALSRGVAPGTVGLDVVDPSLECLVLHEPSPLVGLVLSASIGLGGHLSTVIFAPA